MRSPEEIRRRLETWEAERARFFPPVVFGRISLEKIVHEVRTVLDKSMDQTKWEPRIRQRIDDLRKQPPPDKPTGYIQESVIAELRWSLGENEHGALRKVFWDILITQLHDAECTMRMEGTDLLLEGEGYTYDNPKHPKLRFWLKLKHGKLDDERSTPDPLRLIWILNPLDSGDRFVLTAQDPTLSGILTFSGEDYDFRFWDYTPQGD